MSCDHRAETVRRIQPNGASLVFQRCSYCFRWLGALRHASIDVESIPVIEDLTLTVPPCRRCGARGVELHHWAPRALFPDADVWPQDWLCQPCHILWHQTINRSVEQTDHAAAS